MRKIIFIVAVVVAALAVLAATDPLADLTQEVATLKAQVEDHEARLEYLERFLPVDTYQAIEGAGSTAELATAINNRVLVADGLEVTVTGASVITRQSEIRLLPDWTSPPAGEKLVSVNVNIYNTSRVLGVINTGICPWETRDTLATYYSGSCEETIFWNITVGEDDYPLVGPSDQLVAVDATVTQTTLYFHTDAARPLEGMLTYKHPANESSYRFWKLQRDSS